ncbi:uncharacterized protein [Antedon mediterranea]|uniref:uncharacterized protein n=1 Tax=Antedon mediterranea TaxID=105859 RepID=UPI003AF7837D
MAPPSATEVLHLNVGGHFYTATRATLTRYPDSMLYSMFNKKGKTVVQPPPQDDNNRYCIDGDGPTFRHILNFLRLSKLILPKDFNDWDMLTAEALFYEIPKLIQLIVEKREKDSSELLNLNVGGHFYTANRSTLTRYPKSMLYSMFSKKDKIAVQPPPQDDNNRYYIDRDGPTFRYVLNFLRQSKLILPDGFKDWDLLAAEAEFYKIEDLIKCIGKRRKAKKKSMLEVQYVYTGQSVEKDKLNYRWKVTGQAKFLDQLSIKGDDSKTSISWKNKEKISRARLFKEIYEIGFTLMSTVSTSSCNKKSRDRFDGKDRWIFIKDDSN